MSVELLQGIRRQGAVVPMVALVANAANIFAISAGAGMIGTKTLVIKRLKISNQAGGNTFVHVGTGAAGTFAALLPPLRTLNDTNEDFMEYDLPQVETTLTITAYVDALVGVIEVQVEVEERG